MFYFSQTMPVVHEVQTKTIYKCIQILVKQGIKTIQ